MQVGMKRSAPLAALACAAALFGCAQPQTTNSGLPIHRDPQHRMTHDHWEVIQFPGESSPVAMIVDSTDDASLTLSCDHNGLLLMGPDSERPPLKDPSLELSWDGETGPDGWLHSFETSFGWGFGTDESYPDFRPLIERLKQHRSLEATVSSAGAAPLRYRFSLDQADEAIDHVLAECGK